MRRNFLRAHWGWVTVALVGCVGPGEDAHHGSHGMPPLNNAGILRMLESDDERIAQLNMQGRPLEVAMGFMAMHVKAEIVVDWEALAKQGISRDATTTTVNLFNCTLGESLRAMVWQLRPKSGSVGYRVANGKVYVELRKDEPVVPEMEAEKQADAAIVGKLRELFDLAEIRGKSDRIDNLLYLLSFSKKLSLVVDWTELERVGIKGETTLVVNQSNGSTRDFLGAILRGLKPNEGELAYDIRGGVLRVSTKARLDAEHAREKVDIRDLAMPHAAAVR